MKVMMEKISTTALFAAYTECEISITKLIAMLTETQINTVPFEGSWTAGQLMEHVTKSNAGIVQAMNIEGNPAQRKPDEREKELRKMFLNFDKKMKSPEFILPAKKHYTKEEIIENLEDSVELLKKSTKETYLAEVIKHKAFGEITKLELLYFVKYHMQRHLHQLKNIFEKVKDN